MLDMGANVDCKPKHLLQFAIMASVYMKKVLAIESPRVGHSFHRGRRNKGK